MCGCRKIGVMHLHGKVVADGSAAGNRAKRTIERCDQSRVSPPRGCLVLLVVRSPMFCAYRLHALCATKRLESLGRRDVIRLGRRKALWSQPDFAGRKQGRRHGLTSAFRVAFFLTKSTKKTDFENSPPRSGLAPTLHRAQAFTLSGYFFRRKGLIEEGLRIFS